MATKVFTGGETGVRGTPPTYYRRRRCVVDSLSTATNGVNIGANDVVEAIDVAVSDVVMLVVLEVLTVEAGAMTIDVGDGTDVDGYIDGANGNSSGAIYTAPACTLYTAADTVDMKYLSAADACKIGLVVSYTNMDVDVTTGTKQVS